jgi:hypothetical protein
MADKQNSPVDTRAQALRIKEAWSNIGTANTYGDMKLADLEAAIAALDEVDATLRQLEDRLTQARNEYKAKRYALWDLVKRARAGAKAKHGDDSDEYERFGGTRMGERQRRAAQSQPPMPL